MQHKSLSRSHIPIGIKIMIATMLLVSVITATTLVVAHAFQPAFLNKIPTHLMITVCVASSAFITSLAVLFVTRFFIERPLREIILLINKSRAQDYLLRIPVRTHDTIGELALAFNRLMKSLTRLSATQMETERELIRTQEAIKYQAELELKNRHLSLVYDIARTLSESVASEDAYHEILEIVGHMLDYNEMVLMLHQNESHSLKVVATYGMEKSNALLGMEFANGEGITGEAILNRELIYIPDTKEDPRYLYYKGLKKEDVSFISVPLMEPAGDQVIGVLNISRPVGEAFQNQEQESLQAVSHLITLALTNAHLYKQLKGLSITDELTQLYNRRYGQKSLEREVMRAARFERQLAVLMIDIDYFKKFNDQHGHPEGDVLLQAFAALLKASTRNVDIVARWGGEEFIALLPNTDSEGARQVAEKILRNVRQCQFLELQEELEQPVTASIGVAVQPEHATCCDDLILSADKSLYEAKANGRDQVVVAKATPVAQQVLL